MTNAKSNSDAYYELVGEWVAHLSSLPNAPVPRNVFELFVIVNLRMFRAGDIFIAQGFLNDSLLARIEALEAQLAERED